MNVRNFWMVADIDGRKTLEMGGPRGRYGGMDIIIKMRNNGGIMTALRIRGFASEEGRLSLDVLDMRDRSRYKIETDR